MNEELQKAVAELIQKSIVAVQEGSVFLAAEIPDVVYQLLLWHGVLNLMMFSLGMILLIGFIIVDYNVGKWIWKSHKESDWFYYLVPGSLFRLLYVIPSIALLNLTWLQIWIAPKIFLIEYAAKLIK